MENSEISLSHFVAAILESTYQRLKQTTAGLTEAQWYYQPAAEANSIAWLLWHLYRWQDHITAAACGVPHVWDSAGWAQRWGMPTTRTGLGDTPEQVAAFRVGREELWGYMDAASQAALARVTALTPAQWAQPITYTPGNSRPAWQAIRGMCSDTLQHAGQINYLRGMLSGYGWT